jgi:hypothetical protein
MDHITRLTFQQRKFASASGFRLEALSPLRTRDVLCKLVPDAELMPEVGFLENMGDGATVLFGVSGLVE